GGGAPARAGAPGLAREGVVAAIRPGRARRDETRRHQTSRAGRPPRDETTPDETTPRRTAPMSTFSPPEPAAPWIRQPGAAAPRGGAAAGPAYEAAKRALDLVAAAALLVAAAPLMAAIAALVKLTSPGPIIFRHARLGRGGRPFCCLKFRAMVRDAEAQL